MSELFDLAPRVHAGPDLPRPTTTRWQPMRIGLVELFRYDSEEFWFRDGHLLLRGNNGTGKSKVLALTLPFLFDARLAPSRIEPDGDSGKTMAWNLLLNTYDRRTGYAWLELGRVAEDGTPRYLTLGAGLSAAAARPQVESWFFIVEDAADSPRLGQDLWLISGPRLVLTKERLRETLEGRGQVFDTAAQYRRAVDERLFRLGDTRYAALMDTLIQLRQPQLSKRPDESSLSHALTEALPPLATDLLGDVAEALNQLEEDRRQLEEYQALERAVSRFDQRYRIYAGTQTRRQARALRHAQTEFDNASRAVNEAQAALNQARDAESRARDINDRANLDLAGQRARLDTLRSDPAMQDANRLDQAARDAAARQRALDAARTDLATAVDRLDRAAVETAHYADRAGHCERTLTARRQDATSHAEAAGIAAAYHANPLATQVDQPDRVFDAAQAALRAIVASRRDQIALLRQHRITVRDTEAGHIHARRLLDERRSDAGDAAANRQAADDAVERAGAALLAAWDSHLSGLRHLHVAPDAVLSALGDWITGMQGDNPARVALQIAQQQASRQLATRRNALDRRQSDLDEETRALDAERVRLEAGEDAEPPQPYTRTQGIRTARAGAPLWQLTDFRDTADATQRAGLEAALEAAGLLDAWVSVDGHLQTPDGSDTQVLSRLRQDRSLLDWLCPATTPGLPVPADIVAGVLGGIACGMEDRPDAETWIAPDGRFRLGALAGTWGKPAAVHIGFAARAAARATRLAVIAVRLDQLAIETASLRSRFEQQSMAEHEAAEEWRAAPSDEALFKAHLTAAAAARAYQDAAGRLARAEDDYRNAEQALRAAHQAFADTAADLRLPLADDALGAVETELARFDEAQTGLVQAARELRLALPELHRQQAREAESRADWQQRADQCAITETEAGEADIRLATLREAVGALVEDLQKRLAETALAAEAAQQAVEAAAAARLATAEARAVAETRADSARAILSQRTEARAAAVGNLQKFAATGLLSAALPLIELPDMRVAWTIDPALTLARAAEQGLADRADSDEAWARIQRLVSEDLTELQRALTALGHQAQAETSDFGLVVAIVYQGRPERPDQLKAGLLNEIRQRTELLTAAEREVLENHLQAEIATEVQRLLQAAERQVAAINKELYSRPTSTGMRYRLQWLPLAEGANGAPVGLEAARKRLLNTSTDLWSSEDKRVVGNMLQQRIAAEREQADASGAVSLLEQLSRALDYRRWHEFRVQRWQDGQWRKLSGPASSGERALGLTVPRFAAVASFYSQGGYALAPRLVLLDEAFAGIDAAARAHCMGLIREFDLDFVMTSESEWACYADLPGVSICHLQKREGIDAVGVSRWTWDGRARRRDDDPDRRYPPV